MKDWLLDLLICPACLPGEFPLGSRIEERQQDDISMGYLFCPRCTAEYPISDGIAFLDPAGRQASAGSKYETPSVLSSYLWSHYGDLLPDPEASVAYRTWAGLLNAPGGIAIDLGAAVGRLSFEMSRFCERVIGIDTSSTFVRAARDLLLNGRMEFALRTEGSLLQSATLVLPWTSQGLEFIVGDALALPFRAASFNTLASLNLIDKVPRPLAHLQEMNRVAHLEQAQMLFSDPFSWSTEVAAEEEWLGGKLDPPFAGRGGDNVRALLQGAGRHLQPAWAIDLQGQVWWKIRTHANHFELIRSCYIKASR